MRYRVVEIRGGLYQTQYRVFFFWWTDSTHEPTAELADQIRFAKSMTDGRIRQVMWP